LNIKNYITSGILELYVLDSLEPAKRREVEDMAEKHPEVSAEIEQIELAMEGLALALAPEVSPKILDKLLLTVSGISAAGIASSTQAAPKVPGEKIARGGMYTWLPLTLAAAALAAALYLYSISSTISAEAEDLRQKYGDLSILCDETANELDLSAAMVTYLSNPDTRDIVLAGTDTNADKQAMVFYNPNDGRTIFRGNQLPVPPAGKQYQLWAIDADGPKDLGVLDFGLSDDVLLEVTHVPAAAAFAITLEDRGGKPTPDLTQLQVIGEVKS